MDHHGSVMERKVGYQSPDQSELIKDQSGKICDLGLH